MWFGKLRKPRRSYFRKIFLYIYFVAFVSVLVIGGFVVNRSIQTMKLDYSRFSLQLLASASLFAESRYKSAIALAVRGFNVQAVSRYLNDSEYHPMDGVLALTELRNQIALNDVIHSVYLYNRKTKVFIKTQNVFTANGPADIVYKQVLDKGFSGYTKVMLLGAFDQADRTQPINLITVIVKDNSWDAKDIDQAIIVNLREDSFLQATIATNPADIGKLYILDGHGRVVSAFQKSELRVDLSHLSAIRKIMSSQAVSGTFTASRDELLPDSSSLVSFEKNITLGWTFIHMTPNRDLVSEYYRILANTLLLLLPFFAAGMIGAFYFARRLYSPIERIMTSISSGGAGSHIRQRNLDEIDLIAQSIVGMTDEIHRLSSRMVRQQDAVRDQLLRKSLSIALTDEEKTILLREPEESRPTFPVYLVLLSCDQCGADSAGPEEVLHLRMLNGLHFWSHNHPGSIVLPRGALEAHIFLAHANSTEVAISRVEDLLELLHGDLGTTFSATVSERIDQIDDVHDASAVTEDLLRYRTLHGGNIVLSQESVEFSSESSFEYPTELERRMIAAIRSGRDDEYQSALDGLLSYLKNFDIDIFVHSTTQTLLNVIKEMNAVLRSSRLSAAVDFSQINELGCAKGLEEHRRLFMNLYDQYRRSQEELEKQRPQKSEVTVARVREIVSECLANPNLDLTFIGERLDLSSNYLSRLFKDETGGNLTAYIREKRMQAASDLLKTELNTTIGDIALKCGYADVNYFSYCFKQQFGFSPSAYRTFQAEGPVSST